MSYPLDEEDSKAQLQLQTVRTMHSFARRKSKKLFDESAGEGIALSQYDMAEVLLAFAGIAPSILEVEFGVKLSRSEMKDWVHAWRLIGYHLGIMDEFNCCNSLEDMEAIVEEWMTYVPLRFNTCRPATFELQRTALEGFGKYTGAGVEIFSGMLHASGQTRDWGEDVDYIERPCLPGMKIVGGKVFRAFGSQTLNKLMSYGVLHIRRTHELSPERAKRVLPILASISRVNDAVTWPMAGWLALQLSVTWKRVVLSYFLGFLSARGIVKLALLLRKRLLLVKQ